jgi:hypothetical protein
MLVVVSFLDVGAQQRKATCIKVPDEHLPMSVIKPGLDIL